MASMNADAPASHSEYEAEVIPGLEAFATDELRRMSTSRVRQTRAGFLRLQFVGDESALLSLRSVIAMYRIHNFPIPRPKALLGHEHFTRLLGILRATARRYNEPPQSMGVAAAGSQTAVMQRLRQELSQALGLPVAADGKGELFLRLARQAHGAGWEALVRASPSPLSKRDYRKVDVPGALNATVAFAMTQIGRSAEPRVAVNLCSGSSTILIEHALACPDDRLLAIDICPDMINIGRRHARRARQSQRISHLLADARRTPLPSGSADLLYADLPFGHHIGRHADNLALYPALLREAYRLAKPYGRLIALTHEIRLMARSLRGSGWRVCSETPINLSGLHPRLFVLRKISARIVVESGAGS